VAIEREQKECRERRKGAVSAVTTVIAATLTTII